MLETTLEQKEKIREGLKLGKTYKEIAMGGTRLFET